MFKPENQGSVQKRKNWCQMSKTIRCPGHGDKKVDNTGSHLQMSSVLVLRLWLPRRDERRDGELMREFPG